MIDNEWKAWPAGHTENLRFWTIESSDWIVCVTVGKGWLRGVAHSKPPAEIRFLPKRHSRYLHKLPQESQRVLLMSYVKRLLGGGSSGGPGVRLRDEQMEAEYPALFEHLTTLKYEDGKPRRPTKLSFFAEDGKMKCCLVDPDSSHVAFLSGDGFFDLLRVIEENLATGAVEWRRSRWQAGKGR